MNYNNFFGQTLLTAETQTHPVHRNKLLHLNNKNSDITSCHLQM